MGGTFGGIGGGSEFALTFIFFIPLNKPAKNALVRNVCWPIPPKTLGFRPTMRSPMSGLGDRTGEMGEGGSSIRSAGKFSIVSSSCFASSNGGVSISVATGEAGRNVILLAMAW